MGLWKLIYSFFRWKPSNFSPIGALNYVKTHPKQFKVMPTPEFETEFLDIANKMFKLRTDAPLHPRDIKNIIELTRRKLKLITPQEAFEYVLSLKEYHDAFEPQDLKEIRTPFLKQATLNQGLTKDQAKTLMVDILNSRKTTITSSEDYTSKQLEKFSEFTEEKLSKLIKEMQILKSEFAPEKERNPIRIAMIRESTQRIRILTNSLSQRTNEAAKTWPSLQEPINKELVRWTALISDLNYFLRKPPSIEDRTQMRGKLLSFESTLFQSKEDIRKKIASERAA